MPKGTKNKVAAEIERLLTSAGDDQFPADGEYLSTGSSLLNKAFSGRTNGGLRKGLYYLFVGDTNTGKTTMMMTSFAEAAHSPAFDGYELLHINAEHGANMDVAKYFGQKTADRIEETNPQTLEEFYDYLDAKLDAKVPFVAWVDSMDALIPAAVLKRHKKGRNARAQGEDEKGSFATEKPKINSDRLRAVCSRLKDTNSILVIISQTRQRIGFGAQYDPKTFSGGDALTFYARLQIWTKLKFNLKKKIKGVPRIIGKDIEIRVKKNHITGWEGKIPLRLYKLLVDDVGGMMAWLIEEGHWSESRAKGSPPGTGKIKAPEFNFTGTAEKLVQQIETKNQEAKLRKIVHKVWQEIEKQSTPTRKKRYQ